MSETAQRKRPFVLVVDDDPTMRLLAREALERDGLEVEEAEDAAQALACLARRAPDLVLLDVQMPGMDGFALCEELRRRPRLSDVPVVMMTGLDDLASIQRAYDVGATDFATKPLPWLVLSHRVRYLLRASITLAELRRSRERLAGAQRLARLGSFELDPETGGLTPSEGFLRVHHLPEDSGQLTLRAWLDRIHDEDRSRLERGLRACLEEETPCHLDHRILLPDGTERIVHSRILLVRDPEGEAAFLEGTVQDVTERKRAEDQIRYLAHHDALTGLGNRLLFKEQLERAMARARRGGFAVGVLFLDLDQFKRINDTLGHTAGDQLLQGVADRLLASVRDTDAVARVAAETSVARLGGDEFTVLLEEIRDVQDLGKVARRVLESLSRPFQLEGHEVVISGSVGITAAPDDGDDVEALIRNADAAMYHAKASGRNNYQFYDQSLNAVAMRRLIVEGKLRRGLEADEFELFYQPRVELASGRIVGVEALLRWHDPEGGLVLPAEFIGVAEETGLILPLGEWVLRSACAQLADWAARGLPGWTVSLNLSPYQLRPGNLEEKLHAALRDTGAPPERLELEITESTFLHDATAVTETLERLRGLGIRISLDDFGTGYSSLSQLRTLPVDTIKIDQSFVRELSSSGSSAALTEAIVSMGQALGLRVVAEGVEDEAQRERLVGFGCDEMQGFLVSPALPAPALEAFWRERGGR